MQRGDAFTVATTTLIAVSSCYLIYRVLNRGKSMGNKVSSRGEAVLLPLALAGDVAKVKNSVDAYLATVSSDERDQTLKDFVDRKDPEGNNALLGAVYGGHEKLVLYLVEECGAAMDTVNKIGCFPIWLAAGYNHLSILQLLLKKSSDEEKEVALLGTNTSGDTPLIAASSRSHRDACKILLEAANECGVTDLMLTAVNNSRDTALGVALAAPEPNLDLVDLHLSVCSDEIVNQQNVKGVTPLLLACERDHKELITRLLRRGANPSICDGNGASPLAIASFGGCKEALFALLAEEKQHHLLEKPNKNGCTPLWLAARSGRPEIVKILLDAGANTKATNKEGLTALDAAKKYERKEVVALLETH